MKKLWNRFREWLIRKLGGFTQQEVAEAVDEWSDKMNAYEDHIARLEVECTRKDEALKQAEERTKQAVEETLRVHRLFEQRLKILRAIKILNPFGAGNQEIVEHARQALAEQIAQEAKSAVTYHNYSDFDGNTKIVAVLRVMSGPEPLD